jgi:hypothetical protein
MIADTQQPDRRINWLIFGIVFMISITWAATTHHVWEDYFITFRSSKNLATGHGLVFTPGERLHTFTSPLGVLLPAAASVVTGNNSDEAALWVFRWWSGMAFAGAAVFVYLIARRFAFGTWATVVAVGCVMLDAKSLDFTNNGMETGFLLLFIAYTLWSLLVCRHRRWQHLGMAWAGLMWSRPDSFLYIGLFSAGLYFFNDSERTGLTRGQMLVLFLRAGALCALLYLPWFLWSWRYYGSPVPHTIIAKGGVSGTGKSAIGALRMMLSFPWAVWLGHTSLESTFLPSYFQIGGWPSAAIAISRGLGLVLAFQWVLPLWRVEVRVASFAFCGLHVYLSYFPYFPFPWYLPGTMLLVAVALGGIFAQVSETFRQHRILVRVLLVGAGVVGLGAECWVTFQMNREMTFEQTYSNTGVRRQIGEWLKANADPKDTVFMEPLGNIGYFSGLKTYDYPGLSSREMVEAIKVFNGDWAYLTEYLSPDWLVLRPVELNRMRYSIHRQFGDENSAYKLVKEFNNLPEIERLTVYGRKYIEFDGRFLVFKRQVPRRYRLDLSEGLPFETLHLPVVYIGGVRMYTIHATGMVSVKAPASATQVHVAYGLPEATYSGEIKTDGVEFNVIWTDGYRVEKLLGRYLSPAERASDQGAIVFETKLPQPGPGREGTVILLGRCGPNDQMDWSCWAPPEFK